MLIDAGTSHHGYASDITRTYAFTNGLFSDLIDAMEEEQLGIIDEVTIGMNYAELHSRMHLKIAGLLNTFGLVKMTPENMVDTNLTFNRVGGDNLLGVQFVF